MPSWFSSSRSSYSTSRPAYVRSSAGSTYSRSSSSSYYKRRPRDGYIARLLYKLKRLLRDLWRYARKHPVKVFFMLIMPLISGGALASIAKQFGIRLPALLSGAGAAKSFSGGYYGSAGYGASGLGSGLGSGLAGSLTEGLSSAGGVGGLLKVAKAFL